MVNPGSTGNLTVGELRDHVEVICRTKGVDSAITAETPLQDIGFESLDISELVLVSEARIGREIDLAAGTIRQLETVGDVIEFLMSAIRGSM